MQPCKQWQNYNYDMRSYKRKSVLAFFTCSVVAWDEHGAIVESEFDHAVLQYLNGQHQ